MVKMKFALGAMAVVATFTGQQAWAQEAQTQVASDDRAKSSEGEIVVTATRRDTKLQDTPLPVSVLTGEELSSRGLLSLSSASTLIPGVSLLNSEPGTNEVTIRGVGVSTTTATLTDVIQNTTTSVYLDQLPVTSTIQKTPDYRFVDLQRIEVLKGPQGTLYGQSAMGGVIRYIANKPDTSAVAGGATGTLSTTKDGGENYGLDGYVNIPVTGTLALRAVGYGYRNSGFIDVVGTANVKDSNVEETYGGRLALRWKPDDKLTVDVSALYHNVDLASFQRISSTYTPTGLVANRGFPVDLKPVSTSRLETEHVQPSAEDAWLVTTDIRYEFDGVDANVIVGRKNVDSTSKFEAVEIVGNTEAYSNNTTRGDNSTTTAEFRLSSNGKDNLIDWNVGAYYERSGGTIITKSVQTGVTFDLLNGAFLPFQILVRPGDVTLDSGRQLKYEDVSFYAEATANIADGLKLTGGYRRSEIKNNYRWVRAAGTLDAIIGRVALLNIDQGVTESVNTYKGNLSYKVNENALVFFQAASGYRPGGFNPGNAMAVPAIPDSQYTSDTLWNYELGLKSQWFDNRLVFNLSAYIIDWSDIQLSAVRLTSPFPAAVINAGEARIKGIEVETTFKATDNLRFGVNYAFTDAELTAPSTSTIPGFGGAAGVKGERLPGTPRNAFSVLADWSSDISDSAKFVANGNFRHIGERSAALGNTNPLPSYSMIDVQAGVQFDNGFNVSLFADNLTNKIAITQRTDVTLRSGQPFNYFSITRPRTIGVRAGYKF